jgi:alkanesulfonate monooxygenase SsuD/methylene tetrahydromethanopterin reductase-like flavin-dependent oxidoreductase (luciferase family)
MSRIGYFLSSEEHGPKELVRQSKLAERAGFEGLWISDHYHPWLDEQGQSPFVWSVIGAIAEAVTLPITTAVTCPLVRIHPAVIAQAAATSAVLTGGRFQLGVGTGEALNEHIIDSRWPPAAERLEMLEEAIEVMRRLWSGELTTHRGTHYSVDNARLYTLPDRPPPPGTRALEIPQPQETPMPRCAWLLIGALTLLAHQTIGLPAVVEAAAAITTWVATTPAVLVAIASLAAWHLLNEHLPRTARARH